MSTPPGLILPTQKSFALGAGNPRDSALMAGQQMNAKQASLNASVGGKHRRKKQKHSRHLKGGDNVAVPQFHMQYTPQGGLGTNPNDQIKGTSSTSMQSTSWAKYDSEATKTGGRKSRRNKSVYRRIRHSRRRRYSRRRRHSK
jgi:hypothetical protein